MHEAIVGVDDAVARIDLYQGCVDETAETAFFSSPYLDPSPYRSWFVSWVEASALGFGEMTGCASRHCSVEVRVAREWIRAFPAFRAWGCENGHVSQL